MLALDATPSERASVVERESMGDASMQSEVQDLLAHSEPAQRLEGDIGFLIAANTAQHDVPEHISAFRIIRAVAGGTGGTVYEALQERLDRRVAIKLLHTAVSGPAFTRRWRTEARILARLEHPGIARIYDAGLTVVDGIPQPFIAMEFIEGRTLDDYVLANELTLEEQVELIARVCDAVHFAHTKEIIHRDLKPDNILVRPDGQPVILDFGIARLTDASVASDGLDSTGPAVAGTLGYMPPEQASGADDVDTRSDVYALGAICFKLLTNQVPVDIEGKGTIEALAKIRAGEAIGLGELRADLRGDLSAVVSMALAPAPANRYQSAAALAQDLRAFLNGYPVQPRPWSFWRDARRWGRRYRVPAALAALTLALAGALLFTQVMRMRTLELQTMDNLVQLVVGASSSDLDPDYVPISKQVLDVLSKQAAVAFQDNPVAEGNLRLALAHQYGALSAYKEGANEASRSLELFAANKGPHAPETHRAAFLLTDLFTHGGRQAEAVRVAQEWLVPKLHDAALSAFHRAQILRLLAESSNATLQVRLQHLEDAQRLLEPKLDQQREWDEYARVLTRKAGILFNLDRRDEAIQIGRAAIRCAREHGVSPYPWLTASLQNHGTLLTRAAEENDRGDLLPEAESSLREALRIKLNERMEGSVETLATMHNLARTLSLQDHESREAESLWLKAIHAAEQMGSQDDFRFGAFLTGYGRYLVDRRRYDEGIDYLTRGKAILEQFPDINPRILARANEALARAHTMATVP